MAKHYHPDTAGKTETFFTRHVRLITFLICTGIFLILFLPMAIFGIDMAIDWAKGEDRPQMTLEDVIRLSEAERDLYLSDLTAFEGEISEFEYETHYAIKIEPKYYLRAVAELNTNKLIYFEMRDLESGEQVNILTEDVRAFLNMK